MHWPKNRGASQHLITTGEHLRIDYERNRRSPSLDAPVGGIMDRQPMSHELTPPEMEPKVFVGSQSGLVAALSAGNGATAWHNTFSHMEVDRLIHVEDLICVASYVTPSQDNQQTAHLFALRTHDGTLRWQLTKGIEMAGPTFLVGDGDLLFATFGMGIGAIYAVQAQTGGVEWIERVPDESQFRLIAADKGKVYVRLAASESSGHAHGRHRPTGLKALDGQTGQVLWMSHDCPSSALLVASNDVIYTYGIALNRERTITTLDLAQGLTLGKLSLRNTDSVLAIARDGVAFVIRQTQMIALRIADGVELWSIGYPYDAHKYLVRSTFHVALTDEFLYYAQISDSDQSLVVGSLAVNTGKRAWQWASDTDDALHVNAVRLAVDADAVYLTTPRGIFSLDARDGHLRWHTLRSVDLSFVSPAVLV